MMDHFDQQVSPISFSAEPPQCLSLIFPLAAKLLLYSFLTCETNDFLSFFSLEAYRLLLTTLHCPSLLLYLSLQPSIDSQRTERKTYFAFPLSIWSYLCSLGLN